MVVVNADASGDSKAKILVLHVGALGDCVLSMHLAARVRSAMGGGEITFAARSSIARWAAKHCAIDAAIDFDSTPLRHVFQNDGSREASARIGEFLVPFDHVISFLGSAAARWSDSIRNRDDGATLWHIDPRPRDTQEPLHIVDQWMSQLCDQGFGGEVSIGPRMETLTMLRGPAAIARQSESRRVLQQMLPIFAHRVDADNSRPMVIVHPGSGGLKKCVPVDQWEGLIDRLRERSVAPLWMVGPDELERFGNDLSQRLAQSAPVIFEESIERAADLLLGADAYIGHDAGMTHVAAMTGVPTVAVFVSTDPRVWRPLGPKCRIIDLSIPPSESRFLDAATELLEWT